MISLMSCLSYHSFVIWTSFTRDTDGGCWTRTDSHRTHCSCLFEILPDFITEAREVYLCCLCNLLVVTRSSMLPHVFFANFKDLLFTQCLSLVGVGKPCVSSPIELALATTGALKDVHDRYRTSPSNTCPRCPPQLRQVISVRFMPMEVCSRNKFHLLQV